MRRRENEGLPLRGWFEEECPHRVMEKKQKAVSDRADGGRAARAAAAEESAAVRLHVLRAPAPLHHRHHERPRLLHLVRDPLQPRSRDRRHGQQQHHSPGRQDHSSEVTVPSSPQEAEPLYEKIVQHSLLQTIQINQSKCLFPSA